MLVASWVAGCIPAPQLRPRDGGDEREGVGDASAMDAAIPDAPVDAFTSDNTSSNGSETGLNDGAVIDSAGSIDALADVARDATTFSDGMDDVGADIADAPADATGLCDTAAPNDAGACRPETAPRPIAPITGSVSGSRRPAIRWTPSSAPGAQTVRLCADRSCTRILHTQSVGAGVSQARPGVDLPAGVVFWQVEARSTVGEALTSQTWELLISGRNGDSLNWMGWSDFDGDGTADVVAGAWGTSNNRGAVYGYPVGRITSGVPAWTVQGTGRDGDYFGVSTATLGDVNGDGFMDLAVGAIFEGDQLGMVRVYHGGATGLSGVPTTSIVGSLREGQFGWSLAGAGDLNGDGYGDLLVGAPREQGETGRVYVYFGSPQGIRPESVRSIAGPGGPGGSFGFAIAAVGDMDRDGLSDFIVGAPRLQMNRGEAYGFRGSSSTGFVGVPVTIPAPTPGQFGFSFTTLGDFDGNGSLDFAAGAPGAVGGAGRVLIYSASNAGFSSAPADTIVPPTSLETSFGYAMAGGMDLNGDEVPDLAVGSPLSAMTVGTAGVFLGGRLPVSAPIRALSSPSPTALSLFGAAVSIPGDVDRDGLADLVVATPDAPMGGYFEVYGGHVSAGISMPPRVVRSPTSDVAHFASSLAR